MMIRSFEFLHYHYFAAFSDFYFPVQHITNVEAHLFRYLLWDGGSYSGGFATCLSHHRLLAHNCSHTPEIDPDTGRRIGLETGDPTQFKSFEELFGAFNRQLKNFVDIKVKGNNIIERLFATFMPSPFLSILIDDCIKSGKDYNDGGPRYNTTYIMGVGIGTLTDSLAAIKYHVFDEKSVTMDHLLISLKCNFEGHERIRQMLWSKTPKYGNDDEFADTILRASFDALHHA
jgi:formate C-acetyltransferase